MYLKQLMERCLIQKFIWLCEGLRTENVTCDEDCIAPQGIFVIVPLLLVLFKKCIFTSFSLHREDMNAK